MGDKGEGKSDKCNTLPSGSPPSENSMTYILYFKKRMKAKAKVHIVVEDR